MADLQTIVCRLLLALLLGGIIGAEREYRNKSAGFRTMIMIALGACLFTLFSIYIGAPGNPDRIASNIVTGIGFLGAGIIFKADDRVRGLTTAATIWFTAALGIGAGCGYYWPSVAGCVLGMLILGLFTMLESRIDKLHEIRNYRIVSDYDNERLKQLEAVFRSHHLKCRCISQGRKGNELNCTWKVRGKAKNHRLLVEEMMNKPEIREFGF